MNHTYQAHSPSSAALIVEDDGATARALTRLLELRNWTCTHAPSSVAACARVDDPLDAAIVDLDLGGGDSGEVVVERLASRRPAVATLVVSGVARPSEASRLALTFGVPLIEKPFHPDTFCAALDLEVKLTRLVVGRGLAGLHARTERDLLRRILIALTQTRGSRSAAAVALGIPRTTLRDTLRLYGLRYP